MVYRELPQLLAVYPFIAVKVLGNIQREAETVTLLVLQRGVKPFPPMLRALALLIQDKSKVISIADKVLDAVILLLDNACFRKSALGLQQGAFVQALDPQSVLPYGNFTV